MMADRKRSVEPKAVIVGVFGTVMAILFGVQTDSLVSGLAFFISVLLGAMIVHWVNRGADT